MEIGDLTIGRKQDTLPTLDKTGQTLLPWAPQTIVLLGDIQFGTQDVDLKGLKRMVQWGTEMGAWYLGLGDLASDLASPSNRTRIRQADFYDSVTAALTEKAMDNVERATEVLEPTRDRWVGMAEGHHYYLLEDGTTTEMALASRLGARYYGNVGLVDIRMETPWKGHDRRYLHHNIWFAHGEGRGVTVTSPSTCSPGCPPTSRLILIV